jgi:carboxyl-terminal processing protease
MKKAIVFIFVLFLPISAAFSMSKPAKILQTSPPEVSVAQPDFGELSRAADGNTAALIKSAAQEICDGNFNAAEQILSSAFAEASSDKQAGAKNPPSSAFAENKGVLSDIISQYRQIGLARQQLQKQSFDKRLAELEKLKARPETNEPNLLEIFPVIIRAHELAVDVQKEQVLSDEFVQKTITKSRQAAAEFESKGKWLNSFLYCYSWLGVLYEDDKAISDKRKELEEKALIEASLMDNPCETCADRYQKIKPEMFTRSLDVLEYGYVEPFYYGDMADKVFSRFRNLAEVLRFSDSSGSKVMVAIDSSGEKLPEPVTGGRITIAFSKDKLPDFAAGLDSLRKNYSLGPIGLSKDQFLRLFGEVLVLNSATIRLPEQIVIWHFAEASLSALDPHTMIAWPQEKEDFEKSMTNEFSGIGVEISKADGLLRAVSLLPGTPAYNSGIDAGDVIETINGESTKDMSITCAVSKITGPVGTKVAIAIRRANEEKTRNIEVTRAKIIVPTTRGWSRDGLGNWLYFVDEKDSIGYIRITNFSATTASDLNEILTMLEVQGMRALVLDLRFNTGGFLQSAADVTDMFVDKGIIVSTQPRVGLPTWEAAHKKGTHPYYPLVILINSSSASASEIVAGALADKTYSRAVLVGEQSYGKGSVQTISGYPGNGAQLKYTMAYYHLPDGSRVKDRFSMEKVGRKDWGIMPNVQIELRSDEVKKMIDVQRDNDVLAAPVLSTKAETGAENKSKLTRHGLAETLQTDSQLAVAVLVAKAKLIESGLQQ